MQILSVYNLSMINKKLYTPGIIALAGIALLSFVMWEISKPVSRDPNIGIGLIGLMSIGIIGCGVVWFTLELIKIIRHR